MKTFISKNSFLTEIVDRFLKARVKRDSILIKCFYEIFSSSINKILQINDSIKEMISWYLAVQCQIWSQNTNSKFES